MKLLVQPATSIECDIVPSSAPFPFSLETLRRIETGWEKVLSFRPHDIGNGLLFDRPLLRVQDYLLTGDSLHMMLIEDVSYKDVVGLRANDFLDAIPRSDAFQVASLILVIQNADGSLLLTERNSGDWEHSFELPGGFITAEKLHMAGGDISQLARHIANREVGLNDVDIHSFEYLGALPFDAICEYMQIFRITLAADCIVPATFAGKIHTVSKDPCTEDLELPLHYPSKKVLEILQSHVQN